MYIENARLAENGLAFVLLVKESDILNLIFAFKQLVEEVNQKVLVNLLTEDHLEADIRKRVDILRHDCLLYAVWQI